MKNTKKNKKDKVNWKNNQKNNQLLKNTNLKRKALKGRKGGRK